MRRLLPLIFALIPLLGFAQVESEYKTPPPEIAAVVDVPPPPQPNLSPDGKWVLLLQAPAMLTIDDLSQPELKLAGVRFNPATHDQSRLSYALSLTLVRVAGGAARAVTGLPASPRMRFATWSPDSSAVAFALSTPAGVELWMADPSSAAARRISTRLLNHSFPRRSFEWMPDSRALVARVVPANGMTAPEPRRTPSGPDIQESRGRKAPARTYEDMLRSEADAALFEHHIQSELVLIPLDGPPRVMTPPAMLLRATPSPDGRFLLTETIRRPFSYRVPAERFPRRIEIRTMHGDLVKQIADLPLADQVPIDFDAVRTGPREVEWRSDKPATVFWAEAQDEGNPRKEAAVRDRLFTLADPFTAEATPLIDLPMRFGDVSWGNDDVILIDSRRWKDRRQQLWRVRGNGAASILFDRSYEDRYADPGTPLMRTNAAGKPVLAMTADGRSIYLVGDGASPEGARPFLDRFDLESKKAARLFRSEGPYYDYPLDLIGDAILILRESVTEPPNLLLRDRKGVRALTSFRNPTPQLSTLKKEVIRYKRADGVDLNATLYLPPNYDAQRDGPLPVLMWAYPREFTSSAAAGQITTSPYKFIRTTGTGSPIFFALRGYAVLENPTIPIVGEAGREPNDTYVDQLVAGAKAPQARERRTTPPT